MRLIFSLFLLLSSVSVDATTSDELFILDAEVRQPMPGRTVTSAYFTLTNRFDHPVTLVGASSDAFERVELHQHSHKDGVMRMEKLEQIEIAADSSLVLQPGGLHLMLFNPTIDLIPGQKVAVQLKFVGGEQLDTTLIVVAMPKR